MIDFDISLLGNKVQIVNNKIKHCDIGVYVGQASSPVLKDNIIEASHFSGIFSECESKASLVCNQFNGNSSKGLGVLLVSGSCGLIGKNSFENYQVSPIMVFSTCHPLLKDNCFDQVNIDEDKQKDVEKQMLEQFQADLFKKDQYFYIVDSEVNEKELATVILQTKSS